MIYCKRRYSKSNFGLIFGGEKMAPELYIVLAIILLVISVYIGVYYIKKKHYSKIDELDERKTKLQSMVPVDKANSLDRMMTTGQSKEQADKVLKEIDDVEVKRLPSVESLLFDAEQATDRYRFKQATAAQEQADAELSALEEDSNRLGQTIDELLQREEANLKKIDSIKKRYHKMRKELLAKSFSFGEAIQALEEKLGDMEHHFTSFSDLTASGDHEEAKKIVNKLDARLTEMETHMEQIPELLNTIDTVYSVEMEDVQEGYQTLLNQKYIFPEDVNMEENIQEVNQEIERMKQAINQLHLKEMDSYKTNIESTIDELFDVMEVEIKAKTQVTTLMNKLTKIFYFLANQDREFSLELDRISQSYVLFKNEEDLHKELFSHLKEQKVIVDTIDEQLEEQSIPYSEAHDLLEKAFDQLEELSRSYESLSDILYSYRTKELSIKNELEEMEQDLRDMKRYVEAKHLPGLPEEYLQLFRYTTNHLQSLSSEMARPRLNMEEVVKLYDMCEEDLNHLAEATEEIVDQALLTELTSQRLYRHKEEHPAVMETIKYSENLFIDEYDYETALKMVKEKLESIEPGAYAEVQERYNKEKAV